MKNKNPQNLELSRICDANLNRLREGIRVVEDIVRYIYNNKEQALQLKTLRHRSKLPDSLQLLRARDAKNDVLKKSTKSEQKRNNIQDLLLSNFKRAQESSRVLEEVLKLQDISLSEEFKDIRYNLYTIEKEVLGQYT